MPTLNEKAASLGAARSAIRELFEYGKSRSLEAGGDKICDFSLGNPSVPPPAELRAAYFEALSSLAPKDLHGYTSAAGDFETRKAIADAITAEECFEVLPENMFLTTGAAAALCAVFFALTSSPGDEFVGFSPFFPEYRVFAGVAGGVFVAVSADTTNFQINFEALESAVNEKTKAVVINSPNNPSGAVYTKETLKTLAGILKKKSALFGHTIYIISDEPYRELVYGGVTPPFVPKYYDDTIICYSYSKRFSIPGERLGYALVNSRASDCRRVYNAIAGGARVLGHVCAPSLVQKVIARTARLKPDMTVYAKNREILYENLTKMGYSCAKPDGAFYLFIKSPFGNGAAFSAKAKEKDILVVDGATFGCPEFVRIAYCVDTSVCERSLPAFEELIKGGRGK